MKAATKDSVRQIRFNEQSFKIRRGKSASKGVIVGGRIERIFIESLIFLI